MLASTFPGCGAWSTAADVFALFINGVDYSDPGKNTAGASIPIESLRVSTSLASNASASFDILDAGRLVTVGALSDVVIWDNLGSASGATGFQLNAFQNDTFGDGTAPASRILFSGLVVGQSVRQSSTGRVISVRCVDYGYLLDKTASQTITTYRFVTAANVIQKVTLPPGIMGLGYTGAYISGDARIQLNHSTDDLSYQSDDLPTAGEIDTITGSARSILEYVAERTTAFSTYEPARPLNIYIDPLRRLNAWHETNEVAPVALTDTVGGTNPENLELEEDYSGLETGVTIVDTAAPYVSGVYAGDITEANDRLIAPSSISRAVGPGGWQWYYYSTPYLAQHGAAQRGSFDLTTSDDWHIGQIVTITSAAHGLSAETFIISSADWSFPGGTVRRVHLGISTAAAVKTQASHSRRVRHDFMKAGVQ